jgi:hypothetical protein
MELNKKFQITSSAVLVGKIFIEPSLIEDFPIDSSLLYIKKFDFFHVIFSLNKVLKKTLYVKILYAHFRENII